MDLGSPTKSTLYVMSCLLLASSSFVSLDSGHKRRASLRSYKVCVTFTEIENRNVTVMVLFLHSRLVSCRVVANSVFVMS